MLTIQEVGNEILNDKPRSFYIFCGAEGGVKDKYIEHLQSLYGNKVEVDSFAELSAQLQFPSLVSIPKLYIVRYDKEFLSKVNESTADLISNLYIDGTVILIYSDNAGSKLSKHLGDYTIDIAPLSEQLQMKYLSKEFPQISTVILQTIISLSGCYLSAHSVCSSLSNLSAMEINGLTAEEIEKNFIICAGSDENTIRNDIYSRDVVKALKDLDSFAEDKNYLFYNIMNTMTTLEKQNNRAWNKSDIIAMNDLAYRFLLSSRTISVDLYNLLVILFCSMGVSPIPALGGVLSV